MADSWNWPALINKIAQDIPFLQRALNALLKQDPTSINDAPSGAKRLFEVSSGKWQWQEYNGSSWAAVPFLQHNVDQLDGYHAAITPAANTVAVRNASGLLQDSITGNAATASSAATLSETLPVNKGGTGATTSEQARVNLGAPPTSHASTATTYGVANASQYGHLKLSDAVDSASGATGGTAATPLAVKTAKAEAVQAAVTQASSALEAFAEGQAQKDAGQDAKIAEAQSSADVKLPLAGGTMTGAISFPSGKILSTANEEFAELWISGGNEWELGATLTLFNVSKGGGWTLTTRNGDGSQPGILIGEGNVLTWNARPILTSVGGNVDALTVAGQIVVRTVNGVAANAEGAVQLEESGTWADNISAGSWIRYHNGIQVISIEYCNGSDQTVWMPFPKPFLFANRYSAVCMSWNGSSNVTFAAAVSGRTTTGCSFYSSIGVGNACTASGIFIGRWK